MNDDEQIVSDTRAMLERARTLLVEVEAQPDPVEVAEARAALRVSLTALRDTLLLIACPTDAELVRKALRWPEGRA